MQFSSLLLFAATALASSIHFVNQDSTERTIYFTPNPGLAAIPALVIPGLKSVDQAFPYSWVGNFYSVSKGNENKSGMLGEVNFNSNANQTFFDVSAIVNPNDTEGVKEIFPLHSNTPVSGCETFPCDNAYYHPSDTQTKETDGDALVCTLGNPCARRRRCLAARMSHDLATGKV